MHCVSADVIPVSGRDLPIEGLQSEPGGQDVDLARRLDKGSWQTLGVHFV